MVEKLKETISEYGGLCSSSTPVDKIVVKNGKAVGVRSCGREIRAKNIVSNIDVTETFLGLVGKENINSIFLTKIKTLKTSVSEYELFLGIKNGLSDRNFFKTFIKKTYSPDEEYDMFLKDKPLSCMFRIPSIVDGGLAPLNCHCLSIVYLSAYENWRSLKDQSQAAYEDRAETQAERLIKMVSPYLPGLKNSIVRKKIITPLDLERFTANHKGALYGWQRTPQQIGRGWLEPVTPIENLYLVGHWTVPGGAAGLVMRSADITSKLILEKANYE